MSLRQSLVPLLMPGIWCALASPALPADGPDAKARFTGAASCASTSCHGGGNHMESITFEKKDRHVFAAGILAKGTSLRIAEALGIQGDPSAAAQCTVCHSPMQAVAPARLVEGLKPDRGVSCESCHGAAEPWLRFHTRKDVTFRQLLGVGMRDLTDLYGRANACVACHLNLDESIRQAGHPELLFEMDLQSLRQPPHYVDARPSLGTRSWLTGQAVALRELSWKLAAKKDDRLAVRWKAMVWLLRKTEAGRKNLPDNGDFAAMQTAADQMARDAARTNWTKGQTMGQLRDCVASHAEFADAKLDQAEHRRRAELLVPAIDRLWAAWKKEGGADAPAFNSSLDALLRLAREQEDFDAAKFAAALRELEGALAPAAQK